MRTEELPELAIVLGLGLGDDAGGCHGWVAEAWWLRSLLAVWSGVFVRFDSSTPSLHSGEE
jgi:hypothetical protein